MLKIVYQMRTQEQDSFKSFKSDILKLHSKRNHKVKNSLGVYDAYKYLRKNKWLDIGQPITEKQFYYIIRNINKHLVESFLKGSDIKLPYRLGMIELRKYDAVYKIKDNKLVTNLPIDWNRTLKLWYEDEESYNSKVLLKQEEKEIFKIHYNKSKACYNNKSFYEFQINRDVKKRLKEKINNNELDALVYE